jgi:two-component system, NtrC family, nitrogen regulation response regulator GlnG
VLEAFRRYSWPGNVRELENVVRRMCIMVDGPVVTLRDLHAEVVEITPRYSRPASADNGGEWDLTFTEARRRHLNRFEAAYVRNLIDRCAGNVSRAAEAADVDRKTFYRLLRKHNLQQAISQERLERSEPFWHGVA